MAQSISNTVSTPQSGLVSTNPFLNNPKLATSGTTTPAVGGATSQGSILGVPYGSSQSTTPVTSNINFNGLGNSQMANTSQNTGSSGYVPPASGNVQTTPANNNTGGSTGVFPGLVNTLAGTASQPSAAYTAAQGQYDTANKQLADLKTAAANNQFIGAGTNMAEYAGTQGLLANRLANEENALTGEMNAAQSAAQTATGQQGTQQGGLAAAGGLSQPQQASPTNVPYNPSEGNYGAPASTAFGENGLQGVGNISGQIGVGQNVAQLNSYLGGAQVVGKNLQDLITQNNINPSALSVVNGALQFGAGQLSNPAYQKFSGQINDFIGSLAPIIGVGGNVTDMKTQMAGQIVNALQSGQSINDVIGYFLDQAKQKIGGLQQGGGAGVNQSSGGTTFGSFFG